MDQKNTKQQLPVKSLPDLPQKESAEDKVDDILKAIEDAISNWTPEQREEMQAKAKANLDKYRQEDLLAAARIKNIKDAFLSTFHSSHGIRRNEFTGDIDVVDKGALALAACLELFDTESDNLSPLFLEWQMDYYVGKKLMPLFPVLETVYLICMEKGYTLENPCYFNDGDHTIFHIPHPDCYIICTTDQNRNYLFVWGGEEHEEYDARYLHIRRYWDEWSDDEDENYYAEDFKNLTAREAVRHAETLSQFSDAIEGNEDKGWAYVHRPSLRWFSEHNFDFRYSDKVKTCGFGDCRDPGYCASLDQFGTNKEHRKADKVLYSLQDARWAVFDIHCALTCLEEEET